MDFKGKTRQIPRREFMRAAVAIGGTSALGACMERDETDEEKNDVPRGVDDLSSLPDRQHAWGRYIVKDRNGNPVFPQHQMFVFLDYIGDGTPTDAERETVEETFRTLERAYQWGTGDESNPLVNNGLLFTVGYSPRYFNRFQTSLSDDVDLPYAETVLTELNEEETLADQYDAVLHLGSDRAQVLLGAEEALFGNVEAVNGVQVTSDLTGILRKEERRPGFIGRGIPQRKLDDENIPEQSPLSMGFKSAFEDNLPPEDKMTIQSGGFAGGTTQMVSKMALSLDDWYEREHDERVHLMFSPDHSADDIGEVGEALAGDSGINEDTAKATRKHARQHGHVGHSQKMARARDEDFDPVILRRGDFNATDSAGAALNFGSIQQGISDFVQTRKAMNQIEFDGDSKGDEGDAAVPESHHGILEFIEMQHRGTYLMPPRSLRSLPTPRP